MKIRLILAAIAATLSVSLAQAQDMLPRFEKLLKDVLPRGACPYVIATFDSDLNPQFFLRKDDKVDTEFLILSHYPSVNYLRISARTGGTRFDNKCLLGTAIVDTTTGELKLARFSDCPIETGAKHRDVYLGDRKDKDPTGVEFKAAWEKRAEEFISEAESSAALCKPGQ